MTSGTGHFSTLEAILGRLVNAEIDLQTGVTKAVVAKRLREIILDLRCAIDNAEAQ